MSRPRACKNHAICAALYDQDRVRGTGKPECAAYCVESILGVRFPIMMQHDNCHLELGGDFVGARLMAS